MLAATGYLVNLAFVRRAREKTQQLYIEQDYERGLYYDQYVFRVSLILTSLYRDLDRIHKNIFGQFFFVDSIEADEIVNDMLKGVRSTFCKHVHTHMRERKITPSLWACCESGSLEAVKNCPEWTERVSS
jgi:hypothetical protein